MAVLEAVRGWEALAGLPRLGEEDELGKDEDEEGGKQSEVAETETEVVPEGEWSSQELEDNLDSLLKSDYVSLLFEHDKHVSSPAVGSSIRKPICLALLR
jgi:protein kinase C substrate 80K-H